jgi:hypothetical protein
MNNKKNYPVEPNQVFYKEIASSENMQVVFAALNEMGNEYGSIDRVATASYGRNDYSNITTNLSSRPGLNRSHWGQYRPDERVPTKTKEIIKYAQDIYERVGLIRNIIDLMGDFACQGVRVSHPDKRIEKFYKNWFTKIQGVERSERFLNNLYKSGNVIMRRQTASVNLKQRAQLFKSAAKPDTKIETIPIKKAEIPWKYIFLNPCTVDVVGDAYACFADKKQYVIKFPPMFCANVRSSTVNERKVLKDIPKDMMDAIMGGGEYLLPQDKTLVFHYKKDDWQPWAIPMTYAIFDDVILLEKLKLADIAALDGAISNIRIFKLGSLDPLIIPGKAAAAKLKEILGAHTSAGTIDLVWGPDIELIESKTEVYKFLGQQKYEPVMSNIFGGLGVPPTLTGSFGSEGTTNNFISLQTLIQRLEYGRSILVSFWNAEIEIVRKAMGFAEPAVIEFDYMNLGDEAAEKQLLLGLNDRNLMSDELLQQKFKHNSTLENSRIKNENGERDNDGRPEKVGPFHESRMNEKLKHAMVNKGYMKPEDVGVSMKEVAERTRDKTKPLAETKKPSGPNGRPKGKTDTKPRKAKRFIPKSKASIELWAISAQREISEVLNPHILNHYGKKNMRSLTNAEYNAGEEIKFGVLFSLEPFTELNAENILNAFGQANNLEEDFYNTYRILSTSSSRELGRALNFDELRYIQVHLYSEINSEDL